MPRPRGISQTTLDNYERVKNLIISSDRPYTQKMVCDELGLAPSSVHRVVKQFPFRNSFKTNQFGFLQYTDQEPNWNSVEPESAAISKYNISAYLDQFPSNTKIVKEVLDNPPFLLRRLSQAVKDATEQVPTGRVKVELTGEQQEKLVKDLEQFSVELLRQVKSIRSKPNYGKDTWWLDYVE